PQLACETPFPFPGFAAAGPAANAASATTRAMIAEPRLICFPISPSLSPAPTAEPSCLTKCAHSPPCLPRTSERDAVHSNEGSSMRCFGTAFRGTPGKAQSEKGVHMPNKRANVKNEKQYEKLKEKGMSKERAARIANSPGASSRGGKKSHSSSSRSSSSQGGTTAQKKAA